MLPFNADTLVRGGTVVLAQSEPQLLDVAIRDGRIVALLEPGHSVKAKQEIDATGKHVLPGLIEAHAHLGFYTWPVADEIRSETSSAALGGITTVLYYMFSDKSYLSLVPGWKAEAETTALTDFGFHLGLGTQEQVEELPAYYRELGISSYKFFMTSRGSEVSYMGLPALDDGLLFQAQRVVAQLPGAVLCVHPENIEVAWVLRDELKKQGATGLAAWHDSRPEFVEAEAIQRALYLAEHTGCPIYIVHVTSELAMREVARFRERGAKVWAETCPHYALFSTESPLEDSLGKVNPPIRPPQNNKAIWKGLADGFFDVIGSDHVARDVSTKRKDIWSASAGFPGMGTALPSMLHHGVRPGLFSLTSLVEMMSYNPARQFGLYPRKGTLLPGADADLTIVDLDYEQTATASELLSASGYSLLEGASLTGWPVTTMVRGQLVVDNRQVCGTPGTGRYQPRAQTLRA